MPNDYNDEAKALASQARQFDEARRQTMTTPDIDKALGGGIDYSELAPPGHPNPRAYVEQMIGRAGLNEPKNGPASPAVPRPRTLNIASLAGTRAPAAARPGDVVEIEFPGGRIVTVEVEEAVRQGFIKHDRDGGYKPISDDEIAQEKAEQQRQQQQDEQQQKAEVEQKRLTGDAPDAQLQHTIDVVNSWVPPAATTGLIEDAITNGTVSMANLTKVARHTGLTVEQAQQLATSVYDGVYRQASLALTTSGIPAEEVEAVFAYVAEHHALDHKGAIRVLAFNNDTSVFRDLAGKYKAWKSLREQR